MTVQLVNPVTKGISKQNNLALGYFITTERGSIPFLGSCQLLTSFIIEPGSVVGLPEVARKQVGFSGAPGAKRRETIPILPRT